MTPAHTDNPPLYIRVAVPTPLRRIFHYLPSESTNGPAPLAGARVLVPFGRQTVVGVVTGTCEKADVDLNKLKRIQQVLDDNPIIPGPIFSLLVWAADYYHHALGEVISTALPVLLRKGENPQTFERRIIQNDSEPNHGNLSHSEQENGTPQNTIQVRDQLAVKGPKQVELMDYLRNNPAGLSKEEFNQLGFSASALRNLVKKERVRQVEIPVQLRNWLTESPSRSSPIQLNAEQQKIVNEVCEPKPYLLHGVTGSGKTEIYFQLIDKVLRKGKQVIVLVPEIGLTPQMTHRFLERFTVPVEVMHSGMNDRERLGAWNNMRINSSAILIGTRSAVFTPLMNPGLIVVDEEHDGSFKQNDGFRYSARDLAIVRGHQERVPVILGSATPSLESYYNAIRDRYQLCTLSNRAGFAAMPEYQIIDISNREVIDGLSRPLTLTIRKHLQQGNQVLVFLNRRGYAPVLFCKDCKWTARCRHCDAGTTYHASNRKMVCHHCGTQTLFPQSCPACQSKSLIPLGTGTERTEHALQQIFPDQRIIRIDRDTTRRKNAMKSILDEIQKGDPAVLLGTQLLAKGHHFPNVTLVAILDVDSAFYSSDYKAIERMGQLILQVGGRAGREKKAGTVALQTNFPDHPLLHILIKDGYIPFTQHLLNERKSFALPPVTFQAILRADAPNQKLPIEFLEEIKAELTRQYKIAGGAQVLGPIPSLMEKKANRYRAQLLFMAKGRKTLHQCLEVCIRICENSKMARKLRWSLDVDPMDLS